MPYTNTNFLADLATLDAKVVAILARFSVDGPAHLSDTKSTLVDIQNRIASMRERYQPGGSIGHVLDVD